MKKDDQKERKTMGHPNNNQTEISSFDIYRSQDKSWKKWYQNWSKKARAGCIYDEELGNDWGAFGL